MPALALKLAFAFLKIGAFSFGGGYAVLSFIQREIVEATDCGELSYFCGL